MYFKEIINNFKNENDSLDLNLTDEKHLNKIQELSDLLYSKSNNITDFENFETETNNNKEDYSLLFHTSFKIAKSKKILSEIKKKIHITIVYAIYEDHKRILTKQEHPEGEDFLIKKIKQIENLTSNFKNISWDMLLVDDGCPNNSGEVAKEVLAQRYKGDNVEVLFLQDAITNKLDVVKEISSTDQSIKGGSIEYGMCYAANKNTDNNIIIYTNSDLSIHLGQCGLLVDGIVNENKNAAIGSRIKANSITILEKQKDIQNRLYIYIWKRLINRLNYIVDTQCDFKAFTSETVKKIILNNSEKKLAFDIELLIKTDILKRLSIQTVPIAWIKNDDTKVETKPYLEMLKAIAKMYHRYLPANANSHFFSYFIKSLKDKDWDTMVKNVPVGISIKSPIHYDKYSEIKAPDLEKIIKQ